MEDKKASILGTVLGAIPYIGGSISGWVDPIQGLSRNESADALMGPSFTASAAAPAGMMFGKLKPGTPKQMIKDFIMKSLVASSVASGATTAASRAMKDRHFSMKTASDSYFEELSKEAFSIGGVAETAGNFLKSMYIDPAKNIFKDGGDAIKALGAGDYQNALGRGMSSAGNALWTATNFIPGAGLVGKGITGFTKAVGQGVGEAKNLENAGAIGARIAAGGERVGKAIAAPATAMEKTKGTPLGGFLGQGYLYDSDKMPTLFKGTADLVRGKVKPMAYAGARARQVADTAMEYSPSIGMNVGGDLVSAYSPTGQMTELNSDPAFAAYLNKFQKGLGDKIRTMPPAAQVKIHKALKEKGVLDGFQQSLNAGR